MSSHCEIDVPGSFYIGLEGIDDQNTYVLNIKTVSGGQMNITEKGALARDVAEFFGPYTLKAGKITFTLDITGDIAFAVGPGVPKNAVEVVIAQPICVQNDSIQRKSCEITAAGVYYAVLRGSARNSSYALQVQTEASTLGSLQTSTDSDAVNQGEWKYYGPYQLQSGSLDVTALITGDVSLYVGPNALDGDNVQIRQPLCVKNATESKKSCVVTTPGAYYVGLLGVDAHNNYTVIVKHPANNP